ncbi:hypothetical protein L195_g006711 [Trifolium pratense]|uniref:Uncharacterized protein n=2 Tax=Trifolium pratense TaxID=57577 RepID=A0ACB0J9I6_TRIPR|nr:hypothetical protein L195_g006711 [Trifolium pratense]CAJ2641718.1 unnamed protein product [Trifolium pratense]
MASSTSSLGIACGGNNRFAAGVGIKKSVSVSFVSIGDWNRSTVRKGRIAAVMTGRGEENRMIVEQGKNRGGGTRDAVEAQEKLDRWMKESVVDIVKNLKDAPLLVQVYSKKKGETMLATEKEVVVDDWELVKERWENGETPMPEGVIFVEELGEDETAENGGERGLKERTTKVWGVVVQGKGVGCDPVCYLLKTSRVGSGPGTGMGVFSTHFCLVRVKDFRETAKSQLKNCWLQRTHLLRK